MDKNECVPSLIPQSVQVPVPVVKSSENMCPRKYQEPMENIHPLLTLWWLQGDMLDGVVLPPLWVEVFTPCCNVVQSLSWEKSYQ